MPVPVMVPASEPDAAAILEAGLAENIMRERMHPADIALAMQALVEAGEGPENIAERFGATKHSIRQAARLAVLDPRILEDCREGLCSLDLARTLTLARSPEHGWELYEPLNRYERSKVRTPWTVNIDLNNASVPGDDGLALLVGIDAYREAGGMIIENLFSDHNEAELLLADKELLAEMVMAKLEATVAEKAAMLRGAEAILQPNGYTYEVFSYDQWTVQPWPKDDAPEDALAGMSVLVSVDSDGTVAFSKPHKPKTAKRSKTTASGKDKGPYSQALTQDLNNIWTGGVQRQVASNWETTWDLALFMLCVEQATPIHGLPVRMQARGQWLTESPPDDPGLPFAQPGRRGIDMNFDLAHAYRQFRDLPLDVKQQAAAQAAAQLLEARRPGQSELLDYLARDMNMADYWVPDAHSFWSRVNKTAALTALRKGGVPEDRLPDKRLPKAQLADACAELALEFKLVIPEHRVPSKPEPESEPDPPAPDAEPDLT